MIKSDDSSSYTFRVFYGTSDQSFTLKREVELSKLKKIIELLYDELTQTSADYEIVHKGTTNIKQFHPRTILSSIFSDESLVQLVIKPKQVDVKNILINCIYNGGKNSITLPNTSKLSHLKFHILSWYPELDQENIIISYSNIDLANIFYESKQLFLIFQEESEIHLSITVEAKTFVEYHKKCSFCKGVKAIQVCNRCAIASCEGCERKDKHLQNKSMNFIDIHKYIPYEGSTLVEFIDWIEDLLKSCRLLDTDNFSMNVEKKLKSVEQKFDELIEQIKLLKEIQLNGLRGQVNAIKRYNPEHFCPNLEELLKKIKFYQLSPFYDCEDAMRKLLEFEAALVDLRKLYIDFKFDYNDFLDKLAKCLQIDSEVYMSIRNGQKLSDALFKKSIYFNQKRQKSIYRY